MDELHIVTEVGMFGDLEEKINGGRNPRSNWRKPEEFNRVIWKMEINDVYE